MGRSAIPGLALGLLVAASVYFNDVIIQQTPLLGSYLPLGIFGIVVAALILWNLLMRRMVTPPQLSLSMPVVLIVALAATGWAGASFFRFFPTVTATPGYWYQSNPSWQSHHLLSYVPGGSPEVAPGHLPAPATLATRILTERDTATLTADIWRYTDSAGRQTIRTAAERTSAPPELRQQLASAINSALRHPGFGGNNVAASDETPLSEHALLSRNRAALSSTLPELVLPPPRGEGLLLSGGRPTDAVQEMVIGQGGSLGASWRTVPWASWQPVIRFWFGLIILLGLCILCLAIIVHPQWSQRELLSYPIARFAEELLARRPGDATPAVMQTRGFWVAVASVTALHLVNGIHAWHEVMPHVPLDFDFEPLREMFPNASRTSFSGAVFSPSLYLSVAAFAFFLPAQISFSVGIAPLIWMCFGAILLANGMTLGFHRYQPEPGTMLRLGVYLGMAAMIGYVGRHYYLAVCRAACSFRTASTTQLPATPVWAGRALAVLLPICVWWLTTAGLDWLVAVLLVLICLLIWLVVSRVVCETGILLLTGPLLPIAVLTGLLGHEALGPTQLIAVMVIGLLLVGDPRDAAMPLLMQGLRLADRAGSPSPARLLPWLTIAIVAGIMVAGMAAILVQHQHGLSAIAHNYIRTVAPQASFHALEQATADMHACGTLADSLQPQGWARILAMSPTPGFLLWVGLGAGLVIATALARLRLTWWPLHPAIFVFIGTQASAIVGLSFMVGWAVKLTIVGTGGIRSYETAKPIAIGVISGELIAGLGWSIFGTGYYFWTGYTPQLYNVWGG